MTPIQDTLPEVSTDVDIAELDEIVDELTAMNSDDWSTLVANGVTAGARIEFAFSAPNEDAASDLVDDLLADGNYSASAREPEGELDDWSVRGTTPEVSVTEAGLADWVRRLAAYGLDHDQCILDGWAAALD